MKTGILIVLLTVASTTVAFRNGAPIDSCYNHTIVHRSNFGGVFTPESCNDPCIYNLTVEGTVSDTLEVLPSSSIANYECGQTYLLNVSYTTNAFEGFLVQARDVSGAFDSSSSIYGTFVNDTSFLYRPLECGINENDQSEIFPNSATQRQLITADVEFVRLYWTAPEPVPDLDQLPNSLTFWFTIVQQLGIFFNPIEGPTLARNDSSCMIPVTTQPPTTPTTTMDSSTTPPVTSDVTTDGLQTAGTASTTEGSDVVTTTEEENQPGLNDESRRAIGIGVGIGVPLLLLLIILIIVAIGIGVKYFAPKKRFV